MKILKIFEIKLISKLAGHSSVKTTEIYTHISTNIIKNIKLPV
jgi:site-specific recombinase XerD